MKFPFGEREQDLLVDLFNLGFVLSGENVWGSFVEIFVKFESLNTHFFFIYYNMNEIYNKLFINCISQIWQTFKCSGAVFAN